MATPAAPRYDPHAALRFIVNAASGKASGEDKRALVEQALQDTGRRGSVVMAPAAELARVARREAEAALAEGGAVVAVGGDGTINTIAQAAHAAGCTMGVVAQGTFNYFARTHGIPEDGAEAARALAGWQPQPVQLGRVNEHLFLVNASLGLYPEVLQDREAWKARFGRSRLVALGAALATLSGSHRRLRLRVELDGSMRDVRTLTLFVGNNRLQLEQVGLAEAPALDHGRVAAVILKPIGFWSLVGLLLRGAAGTLGDADKVESFVFQQMTVRPAWRPGRRGVKLACDGEVLRMQPPLRFGVAPRPLWLLKP